MTRTLRTPGLRPSASSTTASSTARSVRGRAAGLVALAVMLAVGTGCSTAPADPDPAATATADAGGFAREAACATGSAGIELLRAGGAGARALAALVVDHVSNERAVDLAQRIIDGTADAEARDQLADWLTDFCA